MANPFLVLGGIAITVITAAVGVLAVPGWVVSAQDASAVNDLASAAGAEETALSFDGGYMAGADLAGAKDRLGVEMNLSGGVKLCVTVSPSLDAYAAVAKSPSGRYFARTSGTEKAKSGSTAAAAIAAVGLPTGVTAPMTGDACASGAEVPGTAGNTAGGSAAPLGEVISVSSLQGPLAVTSHGVYAGTTNFTPTTFFVRSGPDAKGHKVTPTGAILSASMLAWNASMGADAQGNIYVKGRDGSNNQTTVWRIAPDHTSTVAWTSADESGPQEGVTVGPDGALYVATSTSVWKITNPGSATPGTPVRVGWTTGLANILSVDTDGNVYMHDGSSAAVNVLSPAGTPSAITPKFNSASTAFNNIVAGADGYVYATKDSRLFRAPNGSQDFTEVADVAAEMGVGYIAPKVGHVTADGTVYFTDGTAEVGAYSRTAAGVYTKHLGN